jgi:hypothetical protein
MFALESKIENGGSDVAAAEKWSFGNQGTEANELEHRKQMRIYRVVRLQGLCLFLLGNSLD